jgi:hypothetical protein
MKKKLLKKQFDSNVSERQHLNQRINKIELVNEKSVEGIKIKLGHSFEIFEEQKENLKI